MKRTKTPNPFVQNPAPVPEVRTADFDSLAYLASKTLNIPQVYILQLGKDGIRYRATHGDASMKNGFFNDLLEYTISKPTELTLIPNLTKFDLGQKLNLHTSAGGIQFFAGQPILYRGGQVVGVLCVMDSRPRRFRKAKLELLAGFKRQASRLFELEFRQIKRDREVFKTYDGQMGDSFFGPKNEFVFEWYINENIIQWEEDYEAFLIPGKIKEVFSDWTKRIHPSDKDRVLHGMAMLHQEKLKFWNDEFRMKLHPELPFKMVEGFGFLAFEKGDIPNHMIARVRSHQSYSDMRHRLKVFESVINSTNDAILITEAEPLDAPGPRTVYVNDKLLEATGYGREEVLGRSPRMFQSPDIDRQKVLEIGSLLREWKPVENFNLLNKKKSGEEFWVNLSIAPVANEYGWYTHWISIQRDVTLTIARENNKRVLYEISRVAKEESQSGSALKKICQMIVEHLSVSVAEIWLHDEQKERIELASYHMDESKYEPLVDSKKSFTIGEGLPGLIWREGKRRYLTELKQGEHNFERLDALENNDLDRCYGLPLWNVDEITGCVLLYSNSKIKNQKNLLDIELYDFEYFLGSEIERILKNEKLYNLFEFAPDMVCIKRVNGYFADFNRNTEKILGYTKEELLSQPFIAWVHPEDREATLAEQERIRAGGQVQYFENRYQHKDGHYIWLAWSTTVSDERGYFFAVAKDITEIKKTREELDSNMKRYNMAMQATKDAVWEYGILENRIIWSEGFYRVFGYPEGDAYQLDDWMSKVHPEDLAPLMKRVDSFLQGPLQIMENEYRFRHKDGRYLMVSDRSRILRDPEGSPTRIIGSMSDITQYKNSQELLLQLNRELEAKNKKLALSNEELEQFAFVTSHDLQEPLRMITGFLTQLEKKYGDKLDEKARTYIHYAVDGAKRMRRIILDLLEFNRIGRTEDDLEQVDVNNLIEEIRQVHEKQLKANKAQVCIPAPLPVIRTRYVPLSRIFQNLIDNAVKYRKKDVPPVIEINCEDRDTAWYFEVKDNGQGIPKAYFDKVFIIFQRLSHEKSKEGTGMGLAITKKMVQYLGGDISVDSEVGKGSRFMFTIPK